MINRYLLRNQIQELLFQRIISGDLVAGTDLNETVLAEELGVSRTPLREALLMLKAADFIHDEPGQGFFVAPLSSDEATDLYDVLGALECFGLEVAGLPDEEVVERLSEINRRRRENLDGPREQLRLDREWHATLLSGTENEVLRKVLKKLKIRLLRYELLFLENPDSSMTAIRQHEEVARAARREDLEATIDLLHEHWRTGARLIAERLDGAE